MTNTTDQDDSNKSSTGSSKSKNSIVKRYAVRTLAPNTEECEECEETRKRVREAEEDLNEARRKLKEVAEEQVRLEARLLHGESASRYVRRSALDDFIPAAVVMIFFALTTLVLTFFELSEPGDSMFAGFTLAFAVMVAGVGITVIKRVTR
jgi:hypothetical protein